MWNDEMLLLVLARQYIVPEVDNNFPDTLACMVIVVLVDKTDIEEM
jgi:hypothetical protein